MSQDKNNIEEKWLICADPDSHQIYTLNINTNEIRIELEVDYDYRCKATDAINQIQRILKIKLGNWLMASRQIDQYRRRKIPSYLLHKQSSSIPTYLCQSTLSLAFANVNSIKLQVKLNKYKELFRNMSPEVQIMEKPNIVEIEAGLVTGADEVIKSVLREVYQRFNLKLKPHDDRNQFILQIAGLKEYLTGNHPMLSYDRVRISLRGMKHLEVVLTEVPKHSEQTSLFPPMIARLKGQESYPPINFQLFKDVPVLLWYAPVPLVKFEEIRKTEFIPSRFSMAQTPIKQQIQDNRKGVSQSQDAFIDFQVLQSFDKPHRKSIDLHENVQLRPSFLDVLSGRPSKRNTEAPVNDLISMRNELAKKNLLQVEQNVLYSGECDWPFSLRICSIENLMQAFEQDAKHLEPKQRATYNGLIPPQYITKADTKQEGGEHKVAKQPDNQEQHHQVHLKLHKRTGRVLDTKDQKDLYFIKKWIPFGGQEALDELATLQDRYGLDFLPYLLSVEVSLYHGCKLLTSWSQAETKKQPFSGSPKFYQTLTFPGIKISQLPQEARLCFNLIAHSASGETQIFGSTSMHIFDDEKRFRSSMSSLNIWPFYKVDPRLLCMGQYWGLTNPVHNSQIKSGFVNNTYSRLFIQLDQFTDSMKWSLRDEKQMEELGFPKSAKCQRYYQMKNQSQPVVDPDNQVATQSQTVPTDSIGTIQSSSQGNSGTNANTMPQSNTFATNNLNQNSQLFNNKKPKHTSVSGLYPNGAPSRQFAGPYEGYLQVGLSLHDQGSMVRFEGLNERTNHFAPSVMHLNQNNSSFNMHDQSSSQISSFKLNQGTQQNVSINQTNNEAFNQVYPYKNWSTTPRTEDLAILQTLLKFNPLNRPYFTEQHKYILMICRNHYKTLPYALQIFLMAIEWDDPEQVREAHNMIKLWTPLPPEDALPLLDAPFADETVRLYAVERVSILSDDELQLYMLELTQCLMFEKHLFNPLAEMLLERSLQNPWVVGHELFWLLKAQLHVRPSFERYALLLEQLLMLCGEFRFVLMNEVLVDDELNKVAEKIKEVSTLSTSRDQNLRDELPKLFAKLPKPFSFALDSRMEAASYSIEDCKVMDSKKLPLWLAVIPNGVEDDDELGIPQPQQIIKINEDANNVSLIINDKEVPVKHKPKQLIQIIFKNGDDIRQDMLTLQLIKIMDKIWLDAGLDFRMKPYKTISTQDNVGMIEVVTNSLTIQNIHGRAGVMGAFIQKTIWNHLKLKNTEPQSFETATDNFLRSCAGYCVATYVLGIGDRHSGNIMLTDTGHLFHIDFGHFLGNFKSKFGIKRERTKFVLTEEMAFVMGGRDGDLFKKFQFDCTNAYNLVRKHGHFLINIFLMNLSAGMPELQQANNVKYLEDQLALSISDQEATAKFRQEIITSLNDTWRQIDNWFHNMKRKG